ncbi:hypothetical protein DFH09DRAFT_1315250 [Mycena vulgaris]|nr:hypothetical protein DFH09DRAFT_1315250 [Mycena vulgaris]
MKKLIKCVLRRRDPLPTCKGHFQDIFDVIERCIPGVFMFSGFGPAEQLQEQRIPVVYDLPSVGDNLVDHPIVNLYFRDRLNASARILQPNDPTGAMQVSASWRSAGRLAIISCFDVRCIQLCCSRPLWLSDSAALKPDLKLFRTLMAYKVRLLEHTPASSHAIAGDEERGKIMFDMRTFALHCYSTLSACRPRRDLPHIHRSLGLSRRQSQLIIKIVRWTSSSTPQTRPHHAVRLKTDDELRDLGREHVETV